MSAVFVPTRRKFSADQFEQLGRSGILREDERVELLEGEMIDMAPIGSRHASAVNTLSMLFARAVGESALVSTQNPLRLSDESEPQPDLMLLAPKPDRYRSALRQPQDVLLLIEVSDTTLTYDRETKLPLYAKHGVCEVWIVDLDANRLEVYRTPSADGYRRARTLAETDEVTPEALPALSLQLKSVLE